MLTGLRGRLVMAMLLVSAVTLGVAALALFTPLTNQLRDDQIDAMVRAAHAERRVFDELPASALTVDRDGLRPVARALHRGSGADVAIIGPKDELLYSTDADSVGSTPQGRAAMATRRVQHGTYQGDALVAVPLTVAGTPIAVELRRSPVGTDSAVRVVRDAFLVAAAISLVVALLVGLALARGLVRRLRALRDTALRVAELGPVVEVREDRRHDEVGDLTRALVTMQEQLREQEQARRTFVATASHELRTPLTSLTLMLDTLIADLDEPADLPGARRGARGAEAQAERLAGLAGELLDLSRLDAGLPLRTELVETTEVIRSVIAEFEVRFAERGTQVSFDPGTGHPIAGDPGSVAQAMRILIDNALEHGRGTPIAITTRAIGGEVRIAVRDQGPGVPPADRERIFERFARGDDAAAVPGFGLGLAIARRLAQRMGGDVELEPPAPQPGACFVLRLPAADAGAPTS